MRIKTQTDYAISVLVYLAEKRFFTSKRELSVALGIGESYMPRIARRLRDMNWIMSESGAVGGYRISADPKTITLLDVMQAMEDAPDIENNSGGQQISPPAYQVFRDLQSVTYWYFSSITIADLIQKKSDSSLGKQLLLQISDSVWEQEH